METILGFVIWAVLGLAIGAAAKWLMPGPDPGGFALTSLLGIAGALIGGYVARLIGVGGSAGFSIGAFVIAVLGAMALLGLHRLIRRRT